MFHASFGKRLIYRTVERLPLWLRDSYHLGASQAKVELHVNHAHGPDAMLWLPKELAILIKRILTMVEFVP